jgi:hypothetical protein
MTERSPFDPDAFRGGVGLPTEEEADDPGDPDETGRDVPLQGSPLLAQVDYLPLRADLKAVAESLTIPQARFVIDNYYTWQHNRIAAHNQAVALGKTNEPHLALDYVEAAFGKFEDDMKAMLDAFTRSQEMGIWARSIMGVGPVLAAALIAHLDITKAETVGHFWRFAGLDPTIKWLGTKGAAELVDRGLHECGTDKVTADLLAWLSEQTHRRHEIVQKMCTDPLTGKYSVATAKKALARRPWNASLKVVCWKLGESFNKVQNYESDYYGKKIAERGRYELKRNEKGEYADQCEQKLKDYRIGQDTFAYLYYAGRLTPEMAREVALLKTQAQREAHAKKIAGPVGSGTPMLPPGHLFARRKRWGTKLFLAHYHGKAYRTHYKRREPKPYAIEHLGHTHFMPEPVVEKV